MTEFETRQTVRHTPEQMFALVADIEAYPQFVPLVEELHIIDRQMTDDGEIKMSLLDGPFSHLEGVWKFLPLRENATKVSLILEFEISNRIGALAFGTVFTQICNSMVSAFSRRAKELNRRT